jgi:hypothetical protein
LCVKQDILATLSYFDIFDYPLTQTEIAQFLKSPYIPGEFIENLNELTAETWIYKFDEFYMLHDNYCLVRKRRKGNVRAKSLLKTAEKIAGFLSGFPFVKGVAVSGSLSMNFADENSDIDFFIITEKNKLWLARTFLRCFRGLPVAFKKQDRFRMNYFVDEEMLQIREKNIYTATEIVTLLPLRGIHVFDEFFKTNSWSKNFLPNHSLRISYVKEEKRPVLKKVTELLFRNPFSNLLDHLLMKISVYRWSQKTRSGKSNNRAIVMSMDASRHSARINPAAFQKKFMNTYEKKIFSLFCQYENRVKTVF